MFLNLIIGGLAGYAVPYVEPYVKDFMEKVALKEIEIDPHEFDMLTLIALLLLAVAVLLLLGASPNAFILIFGAGVGLFAKRLYAAFAARGPKGDAS